MTTSESTLAAPAVPARGGHRPGQPDGPRQEGIPAIRKRAGLLTRFRRDKSLVLMTLPAIALLLVFAYVPMLGNIVAFQDYSPFVGIPDSPFVGLDNFARVLGDQGFWLAVKNTLVITAFQLVFFFPVPIALAVLLNSLLSPALRSTIQPRHRRRTRGQAIGESTHAEPEQRAHEGGDDKRLNGIDECGGPRRDTGGDGQVDRHSVAELSEETDDQMRADVAPGGQVYARKDRAAGRSIGTVLRTAAGRETGRHQLAASGARQPSSPHGRRPPPTGSPPAVAWIIDYSFRSPKNVGSAFPC